MPIVGKAEVKSAVLKSSYPLDLCYFMYIIKIAKCLLDFIPETTHSSHFNILKNRLHLHTLRLPYKPSHRFAAKSYIVTWISRKCLKYLEQTVT